MRRLINTNVYVLYSYSLYFLSFFLFLSLMLLRRFCSTNEMKLLFKPIDFRRTIRREKGNDYFSIRRQKISLSPSLSLSVSLFYVHEKKKNASDKRTRNTYIHAHICLCCEWSRTSSIDFESFLRAFSEHLSSCVVSYEYGKWPILFVLLLFLFTYIYIYS